jgi:integrase
MMPEIIESTINVPTQIFHDHLKTFHSYTQKDKSPNSRRAYSFGWKKFEIWLNEHGYSLQQDVDQIALHVGMFLSDMAKTGKLKYNSLVAYHAAIKHHVYETMNIKLDHPTLKKAMKGARNDLKQPPIKKAAIKAEHVTSMMANLSSSERLIDLRDRLLLLLGFSGAFRRSELIGIDYEHISFDSEGISIRIPFSKTDQSGQGHHVEIPKRIDSINCPIAALEDWLKVSGIDKGPIFRPITKHGVMLDQRLSGKAVALIVKRHAGNLFQDSSIVAGHSLRRGFVMSSLEADVHLIAIMNQTRHASVNTLKEYASEKKNYKTNALNSILL